MIAHNLACIYLMIDVQLQLQISLIPITVLKQTRFYLQVLDLFISHLLSVLFIYATYVATAAAIWGKKYIKYLVM